MVLIPNDVGVRMRMQTETSLHPVAPVAGIPADLVDLQPGQAFSARIQEVLPENTYKALVAGRSLTLALPEGAKTGDTLELVVIDRTPRMIVAQLANRGATAAEAGVANYEFSKLSPTAQLIGALLARDGAAPPAAALTRGQPLLAAASSEPAKLAAELAPQLAKAVSQSGLFYESHQVQWVMGQRPLRDLLVEPQAKYSAAEKPAATGAETGTAVRQASSGGRSSEPAATTVLMQNLSGSDETRSQSETKPASVGNPAAAIPEDLRPLVQQQLDAAATQRLAWHGEVWPGQSMDWQIEPDQQRPGTGGTDAEQGWITSLRLVTPRLGEIEARISLSAQGVRIILATPTGASAADLRDASPALEKSMAAAGVPLLALQVKHGNEE